MSTVLKEIQSLSVPIGCSFSKKSGTASSRHPRRFR